MLACVFFISKMWHVLYLICKYLIVFFHVFRVHILPYLCYILPCSIFYVLWPHVAGLNEQNKLLIFQQYTN